MLPIAEMFSAKVPRYTSYPTAPHFHAGIDGGTYEEWLAAGRGQQGAKPVNTFFFGRQRVRTRNYVVLTEEQEELDLLALLDAATLGKGSEVPQATAGRHAGRWVDAEVAGVPERAAPAQPWAPREPQPFTTPPSPGWFAEAQHMRAQNAGTADARQEKSV